MKLVTDAMEHYLSGGAWIRKIFEQGLELKKRYGEDAVCDFSLGNPDLPPPAVVGECLADLAGQMDKPFSLGYMCFHRHRATFTAFHPALQLLQAPHAMARMNRDIRAASCPPSFGCSARQAKAVWR